MGGSKDKAERVITFHTRTFACLQKPDGASNIDIEVAQRLLQGIAAVGQAGQVADDIELTGLSYRMDTLAIEQVGHDGYHRMARSVGRLAPMQCCDHQSGLCESLSDRSSDEASADAEVTELKAIIDELRAELAGLRAAGQE